MSLKLNTASGGSITLQEADTASNLTATLPASTGTVMVSGNMPAFSAYQNSAGVQTVANNTFTKVTLNTEEFDTANCFDSTTNYRFTPNVAGYYQINFGISFSGSTVTGWVSAYIWKNGSAYKFALGTYQSATGNGGTVASTLVYCNGSTDYIEFYTYQSTGASQPTTGSNAGTGVWVNGVLVRAA
jgi:hypothetical protein